MSEPLAEWELELLELNEPVEIEEDDLSDFFNKCDWCGNREFGMLTRVSGGCGDSCYDEICSHCYMVQDGWKYETITFSGYEFDSFAEWSKFKLKARKSWKA